MEVLLRRHQRRVYRICRRLCPSEPDALDATQYALVTIARRIDRFDGRAAFTTWLYRVTTNACLDELRRHRRQAPVLDPVDTRANDRTDQAAGERADGGAHGRHADPADLVADRMAIDDALAELTPEFRAAVVLRDVGDLEYAEIAEVLGVPVGTVRSRIARGRAQLADLLGRPRADRRETLRSVGDGNSTTASRRPSPTADATPPGAVRQPASEVRPIALPKPRP
jgi:RNA polymerase sigma-70 factor (ECF subfamily)